MATSEKLIPIRQALLSVSDKTDLIPFAKALSKRGVTIVSTGGTATTLIEAGLDVVCIDELTGFPEIMDGRVKTLHPKVHGGLLARRDKETHQQALQDHDIQLIDLVCVNLYPFERTMRREESTRSEIIEQIDIGGPAMIRSAAKNAEFTTVVTSPDQYDRVINELETHDGATTAALRADLAATAFSRTAEYDAMIAAWMYRREATVTPDQFQVNMTKVMDLRYGENPHQRASLYRDPTSRGPTVVNADRLHGRPLSFNNLNDAAAALALVREFDPPTVAAAIIKHTNPCGAAIAETTAKAFEKAYEGDPLAAYGGILAFNGPLNAETAERIAEGSKFFEVIVASSFYDNALSILMNRWASVRLLAVGDHNPTPYRKLSFRSIPGGMLVQDQDLHKAAPENWQHMAGPEPSRSRMNEAAVVWNICKHLKSNAIAIGGNGMLYGAGPGQMDRVTSCRIAVEKAGDRARGAVAASDAFFPFPDAPEALINAGVELIVQPGGSKRDHLTIDLCNDRHVTCLFTGVRHFKH